MPSSPLVSVVIPCYNQGQFLRDAVASIGRSTLRDVEILVVDDGSTDETAVIAGSLAGVRCIVQRNTGLAGARNRGFAESRGRFVVFLDADDMLAPGALDVGVAELDVHRAAAFVFGRCRMMASDGTLLPTPEYPRTERDHYRELLKRNLIWMPAMAMHRRESIERAGGFDGRAHAAADYALYLRVARVNPLYDHGQVVASYRRHNGNMSGSASRMLQETLAVLRRERPYVEHDPQLLQAYYEGWQYWQDHYGSDLTDEIRAHLERHEWRRAVRKATTLGWLHPRGFVHHATHKVALTLRLRKRVPDGRTGESEK